MKARTIIENKTDEVKQNGRNKTFSVLPRDFFVSIKAEAINNITINS